MFGIILTAVVTIILWYFLVRPYSYWTRLGVKQSKPWLVFGDTWEVMFRLSSFNDFLSKHYNMHPEKRFSGIYNLSKPVLLIRDPELIKQITIKNFEHFTDHPPNVDPEVEPIWSNAILSLKGDRWKEMRVTLSPTFTGSKLKSLYPFVMETVNMFVERLLNKGDKVIEIEMKEIYSRYANDIIAATTFGVQVNAIKEQNNTFHQMGKKLTNTRGTWSPLITLGHQVYPKLFKFLGVPFIGKEVADYYYSVMDESLKAREEKNIVRNDMINLMLETRKDNKAQTNRISGTEKARALTDSEIASQAMIFLFAGFEIISTVLSFCSYELALNKEIQDRLREEIIGTQKDGKVTCDELMQMKYMDMVVSEILRKWPQAPNLNRLCTKPFTIEPVNKDEKPLKISLNQSIWIPIYGLQRDPKYFPDPEKFDPERFSDENKNSLVPYTYLPFGVGPRFCIGNRFALLEIKAMLFEILLKYEIVPTSRTPIPMVLAKDVSQIPENGFWIGFKPIINSTTK